MAKVLGESGGILFWGDMHLAQHAFHAIALMAQKSSWCLRVMAMIGPDVLPLNGPQADSALVILEDEKSSNHLGAEPGSPLAKVRSMGGVFLGVGFQLLPSLCMAVVCCLVGSSPGTYLRSGFIRLASFLRLRCGMALALCGEILLAVSKPILAHVGEVFGPLLRRALRFSFARHLTSLRNLVTHSVV